MVEFTLGGLSGSFHPDSVPADSQSEANGCKHVLGDILIPEHGGFAGDASRHGSLGLWFL